MKAATASAHSDDIVSAKGHVLKFIPSLFPGVDGWDDIEWDADKSDRGWFHPQTSRQICPVDMLDDYDDDPES